MAAKGDDKLIKQQSKKIYFAKYTGGSGYTIIEMLVTNSVFALCLFLVCTTMIFGANLFGKVKKEIESKSALVNAFETMKKDLSLQVPGMIPFKGDISKEVKKTAIWQIQTSTGLNIVQYSIINDTLVRKINGEEKVLLQGVVDFEIQVKAQNLVYLSVILGKESLSGHARMKLLAESGEVKHEVR